MSPIFYTELACQSLDSQVLDDAMCQRLLSDPSLEILALLEAAFKVRQTYFGRVVNIHILNNAQNGHCQEDCQYCAQAKSSKADIEEYGIKPDEEILREARRAYSKGASCYCMVYAGRKASSARIERLKRILVQIKSEFPDKEICVSTGFVSVEGAQELKKAGLSRLNHNLNTSEAYYPRICTTHTFQDRLDTLLAAKKAGLQVCSGVIIGMGEDITDIIDVAKRLRFLEVESIPVNFFLPIAGQLRPEQKAPLTPDFVLRVLCLFRFLNPRADIRIAAGRELYLRAMEVMALYPANSLFLQGYLNAKGASDENTLRMIKDAGFTIKSEQKGTVPFLGTGSMDLKTLSELRPTQ
ncbi:MAG: biotin synthase BioB [Candidatus Omnitrophica bacterium]|nr:biotin synthase BioB [Candidatus Omnitrophota bacterium]